MIRRLALAALMPALLPLAAPAGAQAVSALKNHNSDGPVDVEADRIEVQDRSDRALFSGNVRVKQGNLNLAAQRLTVAYANASGGNPQIQRLDASGGVVVQSPSETATGNIAIYDLNRRLITMLGNVVLTRGANQVKGGRLVMDLNSGRATVDGSAVAGGGTGVSSGRGGRVTGRFTVAPRSN
ncbi:LptA/OstA family protein [Sphingomonas jatrophae]|uniref:Lipopolysaccharide export system protein LptA n=1 Tax=Sphingomonas jatrophae TaxID=1166337 RepID=A0A1I6LIF7_9SPHN|nr:LptA/OstA family protein [Sphingomonas jatrophae]SFS03224.1 lipopolysaccharide export system protein LptA [Sphingomonas jatrophae]